VDFFAEAVPESIDEIMIGRREVLKLAFGIPAAGLGMALSDGPAAASEASLPAFGFGEPTPFDPVMVTVTARALAKQAFKPAAADTPEVFKNLGFEQYAGIRQRPGTAIFAADALGFAVEPLHRGFIFVSPMQIHIVSRGEARRVLYDPSLYDFGKLTVPPQIGDIGFSGFRVLTQRDGNSFTELATFQGASFFRGVARGQFPGAMARAMSIKTADPRGEEFPAIRAVWIERPTLTENRLVVHALIDSESLTGAYRFTLRPGEVTLVDTECTLFPRTNVDSYGLATMSATVLSGPVGLRRAWDLRPTIAEIGGVQMLTGADEWIWRPVANRETLQISTFVDAKPRGFGFLQRDRAFDHYQDDDQRWESRPSLWIEPIGDWASGGVQLLEIPSDSEGNDNIIAFWKPREPLAAGSETSVAYRQFWCWSPPARPDLSIVVASREGRGVSAKRRRFLVEFEGDVLGNLTIADIMPKLSATPGSITSIRIFMPAERKACRVLFELDPEGESYSELRLVLEVAGKPISETWLYRWTP
jgi:glucans biosynthesis protein